MNLRIWHIKLNYLKKNSNEKIFFFNSSLGRYVSKNSLFKEVSFKGRGEFAYWVKHFLTRNTIKIRLDAAIQIQMGKGEKIEIHHEKESLTLEGLSGLKEYLQIG